MVGQHGDLPRVDRVLVERRCAIYIVAAFREYTLDEGAYLRDISSMRERAVAAAARVVGHCRPRVTLSQHPTTLRFHRLDDP